MIVRMRTPLRALIVAVALTLTACQEAELQMPPGSLEPLGYGGDFTLTSHEGKPFNLEEVRGKAVLMFFGYTSCPDMCPLTMSRIASAREQLGGRVATLFVSVDANRDTPAVLKEYVGSFAVPMIGLTGTDEEIMQVAAAYHAQYQMVPASPTYLMNHTTSVFLIDPQGQLRGLFAYNESPETLATALRAVLEES
jgi:protein SCO1